MTDTEQWLLEYLAKRTSVPGETPEQKLAVDYVTTGLVDSLEMVELVETVEKAFGVRFQAAQMEDVRFRRIGGLAEIVAELRSKQ